MEIREQGDVLTHLLSMATQKKKIALEEVKRLKQRGYPYHRSTMR